MTRLPNTFINATLELESAIQQYQRAEANLGGAVTTISKKVDTINQHIDKVMENAPTKLKVSVQVNDADWQKIQELPQFGIRIVHKKVGSLTNILYLYR